jgi:hypothetical protein
MRNILTTFRNLWGKFYWIPNLISYSTREISAGHFWQCREVFWLRLCIHITQDCKLQQDEKRFTERRIKIEAKTSYKFTMYNITHIDRKTIKNIWNISEYRFLYYMQCWAQIRYSLPVTVTSYKLLTQSYWRTSLGKLHVTHKLLL